MTDLNQVYADYLLHRFQLDIERGTPPLTRIWDGSWNLFAEIHGEFEHEFRFIERNTGMAHIDLPLDHYISEWATDPTKRPNKDMHLTFDKDGARWSGKVNSVRVTWGAKGRRVLRLTAKHDYEHLKKIRVWSNPFSMAEVQIPKSWMLWGPARWAASTTLFVNLLRKNASLWMLPDDPLDFSQWFNLDMSNWDMVVKPIGFFEDQSLPITLNSRFKDFHSCVEKPLADAQVSVDLRRFLPGDPQPIPGMTLKHGCLVVDFVDKSGWHTETSFGGSLITGLKRAFVKIGDDGITEGVHYIEHPDFPAEYSQPGFKGTMPEAPWVVLEDGPYTGIETTEYEWNPPGAVQFVAGGSSMPFVNEGIKAAIIALGGLLGSAFGQSQVGAAIAEVASPLIEDTLFAFQAHKMHDRIAELGSDPYFEEWVEGSDRAYTISAMIAMRKAKYDTRERQSATVELNDGVPYKIGYQGAGDMWLSDRVAVHAKGMPKHILFVEQVEELAYKFSEDERGWEAVIGQPETKDPVLAAFEKWEETATGLRDLGVL